MPVTQTKIVHCPQCGLPSPGTGRICQNCGLSTSSVPGAGGLAIVLSAVIAVPLTAAACLIGSGVISALVVFMLAGGDGARGNSATAADSAMPVIFSILALIFGGVACLVLRSLKMGWDSDGRASAKNWLSAELMAIVALGCIGLIVNVHSKPPRIEPAVPVQTVTPVRNQPPATPSAAEKRVDQIVGDSNDSN